MSANPPEAGRRGEMVPARMTQIIRSGGDASQCPSERIQSQNQDIHTKVKTSFSNCERGEMVDAPP